LALSAEDILDGFFIPSTNAMVRLDLMNYRRKSNQAAELRLICW